MQLKPWYDWSEFRQHIMTFEKKRPDLAGKRAQAILRACMLRRKKDSKLYVVVFSRHYRLGTDTLSLSVMEKS